MSNKPLFSVVTVCYNAGNLIRKTIESVAAQNTSINSDSLFTGFDSLFEYIIQDGASTDDTISIVSEYQSLFADKGISMTVNSEKDGGIYDAMNKAVRSAKGTYVIFMNADDCFYSDHVLKDISESLSEFPDIIYGDCIIKELGMYFKFRKCFDLIKTRMPFSHQACFAKRELLTESPFNTSYRITADYAFLLKNFINGKSFFDSNVCIALVTADGLSSVHMLDTFIETNKVCNDLNTPRFSNSEYVKKLHIMKIKQFVLSYFPGFIKLAIRKFQIKKRGQLTEVIIPHWCK